MSNYKRHSQGGRFKRGSFGDLGLRAYKDQQDRQIQHLKDQNRQEQLYSQQHLRRMEGTGAKEIAHNRMLQGLEEDVGKLALSNTKIRADREIEAIKGKAKEAEKQADFWQNFSTTYAGQYQQAATELYDVATTKQMYRQMDVVKNHPAFQQAINDFAHLNKLSSHELQKAGVDVYFDPTLDQKTKADFLNHLTDLGLRMNHKTKKAVAKMILDDWGTQHTKLKDLAAKNGATWNEETIGEFYYLRARELLTQLGISHTSEAGQILLRGIDKKEFEHREDLIKKTLVARDEKYKADKKERAQGLVGKMDFSAVIGSNNIVSGNGDYYTDYSDDFNDLIMYEGTSWTADSKGNPVDPDLRAPANLREDFEVIAENWIKAGVFKSKKQAENHLLNVHIPGAKSVKVKPDGSIEYSKKETWGGKHPQLAGKVDDWWSEYSEEKHKKAAQSLKNEDKDTVAELLRRQDPNEPDYIDLTNPDQVRGLMEQYSHLEETTALLGNYEVFSQTDKNQGIVNTNLNDIFKDNKLEDLSSYVQHLTPDQKKLWQDKLNTVRFLHRNGYDEAGVKRLAKGYLNKMVGTENIKNASSTSTAHYGFVQKGIQQEIMYQASLLANKDISDAEKLQAIDEAIRNQMQLDKTGTGERGTGIFRRTATGTKTTFLAYWNESDDDAENSVASLSDIEGKLKNGSVDYNTLIEELANPKNEGKVTFGTGANQVSKYIVGIDQADIVLRNLKAGKGIKFNATIEHIYENQPKIEGRTEYSRRDIWNNIFKSLGINEEIPQGYEEFQEYTLKNTTSFNVDTSKMNEEDKERTCLVAKCAENGIIDTTQPSKESQNVIRQKEIRKKIKDRNPFFPI